MNRSRLTLALVVAAAVLVGCTSSSSRDPGRPSAAETTEDAPPAEPRPEHFTIVPDDYHVPYAGTAEDGRKFFLSDELFDTTHPSRAYVGLFLWKRDGSFDELRVDRVGRPAGVPPGQAAPAGADELMDRRLEELGDYVLQPIEVTPFTRKVDGVTFGWKVGRYDDGSYYINIEPGNFIAYYAPWDGLGYDT